MILPLPLDKGTAMAIAAPAPTVASGFWATTPGVGTPTTIGAYHRNNTERVISMSLGKPANRGFRKVWRALNGVAPGGAVVDTYTRITAPAAFTAFALGGLRAVETFTGPYNGVTTAAQVTYINTNIIDPVAATITYPVDLSGNGGGGKVQR